MSRARTGAEELRHLAKLCGEFNESVWDGLTAEQILGAIRAGMASPIDLYSLRPVQVRARGALFIAWRDDEENTEVARYRVGSTRAKAGVAP